MTSIRQYRVWAKGSTDTTQQWALMVRKQLVIGRSRSTHPTSRALRVHRRSQNLILTARLWLWLQLCSQRSKEPREPSWVSIGNYEYLRRFAFILTYFEFRLHIFITAGAKINDLRLLPLCHRPGWSCKIHDRCVILTFHVNRLIGFRFSVLVLLGVFRLGPIVEVLDAVRCCLRRGASARADPATLFCSSNSSNHYWWKLKRTHPRIPWLLFMRRDNCPNIRHHLGWTTRRWWSRLAPKSHEPTNKAHLNVMNAYRCCCWRLVIGTGSCTMSGSSSGTENVCLVDPMNSISRSSTLMISTGIVRDLRYNSRGMFKVNWMGVERKCLTVGSIIWSSHVTSSHRTLHNIVPLLACS